MLDKELANNLAELQKLKFPQKEPAAAELAPMLREILAPIIGSMTELVARNTEALEKLAAQQKLQSDRMAALEKQIKLNTPVTPTQAKYINEAIKRRAKEIQEKKGAEWDAKALKAVTNGIKKAVLVHYGIPALNGVPAHEYHVCLDLIEMWNDAVTILEITRAARKRKTADILGKVVVNSDDHTNSGLLEE